METLIIENPNESDIKEASRIIRSGGLVVFPTETVYGLGASALDPEAAKKIYAAKGRPSDNPLIIHLSRAEEAEKYCYTNEKFYKLAECFMPGPLTVILPKRDIIPMEVTGGLSTVAVRVPMNEIALELIKSSEVPIAAPSANISGRPSPTCPIHVINDLGGKVDAILCGGECEVGLESTIVRCEADGTVSQLRPGAITPEMLSAAMGGAEVIDLSTRKLDDDEKPIAPGMKYRHYAPKAKVTVLVGDREKIFKYMEELSSKEEIGFLTDFETAKKLGKNAFSYGKRDSAKEMAHNLFKNLREFDEHEEIKQVYADMPKLQGLGLAVYNRLIKAAGFDVREIK
ncbi:MAG: threonylcarbamoyl-AMP synthase [Ruminococcaceae bacterium]|nr:threonylcarbamoyl-AMP synthase [Oscillospiraceae bacterium]